MRVLVVTVALLALCGCLSGRPEPASLEAPHGPPPPGMVSCIDAMNASHEYRALRGKLPPMELGSLPSAVQQADPAMATPEEARLVMSFHQQYVVPCRQQGLVRLSALGPAVVAILVESFIQADATHMDLVEGRLSWGEYNRKVHAQRLDTRARLGAVARDIDAHRFDETFDARQRQAAIIALADWQSRQRVIVAKQRLLNPGDPAHLIACDYLSPTLACSLL